MYLGKAFDKNLQTYILPSNVINLGYLQHIFKLIKFQEQGMFIAI